MFKTIKNKNSFEIVLILLPTLLLLFAFLFIKLPFATSQTMSNSDFVLRFGNLNTMAGKEATEDLTLSPTVNQTTPEINTDTNFKIKTGFQYIKSTIPFSFSISQTNIDFGNINPTVTVMRSNNLTVSNDSTFGYTVTASENHPLLMASSGEMIPDTSCDAGTCNTTTAALWNNPSTFGFGYRCDNLSGTDCDQQFSTANFYKPFAGSSSAIAIMTFTNVGKKKQAQITYKVNISNAQAAKFYTNIINFIATPNF